jgi:hypothetical protein
MMVGATKEENNIVIFDGVETLSQSLQDNKVVAATENSSATLNVRMNAINSSVATRPPRVPKPESGVTIHTDTEDHSNRHRSFSQPRPSQPIELEQLSASKVNSSSKRSASQPRSLQQHSSHFLEGFNLAGSFDVGAIPDPPTPSSSKSRNRRRVSSGSVLRPMSSRDVTNRGNNNQAIETSGDTPTTITTTKSGSSARRKRKTLSHVPSPLIQEDKQKDLVLTIKDYNQGKEENYDVEMKPKTLRIDLCHDEISPKRRKKSRQSMVIPINLPLQEDVNVNAACDDRSCPAAAAVPVLKPSRGDNSSRMMMNNSPLKMKKNRKIFPGDLKSMQELRNLVRGYCAISSETERGLSEEAKSILEITGYELPKKIMTVTRNSNNNSRAILSNRRLVIQKIAPVLTQMEKRRERDTKQWETGTNCRVTKSTKSGRYRYYDIDSNQKISSHEYKQRYIAVIEDGRPQRMARAEAWISRLDDNAEAPTEDVTMHVTTTTLNKNDDSSENFPASEEPIVIGIQEQKTIEKNAMKQKEAFSPPNNDSILVRVESTGNMGIGATDRMDICDMSMSMSLDYGEQSISMSMMTNNCHLTTTAMSTERNEIAEISEASSEDVDENQLESRTPSPTNPDEIETGKAYSADDVSNPPPLSLPSRDTESIDPDIAQAERRLWDRIDLALHEYSEEIMMISEEKNKRMVGAYPSHGGKRQQLL